MKLWLAYPDTLEAIATVIEKMNTEDPTTADLVDSLERHGHLGVYEADDAAAGGGQQIRVEPHDPEHADPNQEYGYGYLTFLDWGAVGFIASPSGSPSGEGRGWLDSDDLREAASMCRAIDKILTSHKNSLGPIEYRDQLDADRIGWFVDQIGAAYGFSFTRSPA